jgi:hypothetical protein
MLVASLLARRFPYGPLATFLAGTLFGLVALTGLALADQERRKIMDAEDSSTKIGIVSPNP